MSPYLLTQSLPKILSFTLGTQVCRVSLTFDSRAFYFSLELFINILRKNFMADRWCGFNSSRCTRYAIVSLSLFLRRGSQQAQTSRVPAAIAIRRFGQRCARVRRLRQRLAILRAVDEFRSRVAPKGGRGTADAIGVERNLLITSSSAFPGRERSIGGKSSIER